MLFRSTVFSDQTNFGSSDFPVDSQFFVLGYCYASLKLPKPRMENLHNHGIAGRKYLREYCCKFGFKLFDKRRNGHLTEIFTLAVTHRNRLYRQLLITQNYLIG